MRGLRAVCRALGAGAVLCMLVVAGEARPARCTTADDGNFRCDFLATDGKGSFVISAPGKPTYRLDIDEPGVGFGFVKIGGREIPLAGRYRPDTAEAGCWVNDTTNAKLCAK